MSEQAGPAPSRVAQLLQAGLVERAVVALQMKLAERPGDAATLRALGHLHRQLGFLERSADVFERLVSIDPTDAEAMYFWSMFTGRGAIPPPQSHAMNFLLLRDFLAPEEYEHLQRELAPLTLAMNADRKRIARLVTGVSGAVADRFRDVISTSTPTWCNHLGVPPFTAHPGKVTMMRYGNGEFFPRHKDDAGTNHVLEVVYYFRFEPRTFGGGQLIVYDRPTETGEAGWTAVPAIANCLAVFPSTHWHEIAPVTCDPHDPLAGRFMLASSAQHPA